MTGCSQVGSTLGFRDMKNYAETLKSENVLILDEDTFNSKIKKIQSDGIKSLQCVFDFDATISKAFHKGEKV